MLKISTLNSIYKKYFIIFHYEDHFKLLFISFELFGSVQHAATKVSISLNVLSTSLHLPAGRQVRTVALSTFPPSACRRSFSAFVAMLLWRSRLADSRRPEPLASDEAQAQCRRGLKLCVHN